jgi:predicted DCC family thiol-disulfide oxidoreductase YuxK
MATTVTRLWVLYDPSCGFCVRCARWLAEQRAFLPLTCLALDSEQIARRFPTLPAPDREELTVVDSAGGVYRGAKAWLMTLWALQEYRAWSLRLARPGLLPLARNAFEMVSSSRHVLSRMLRLKGEREIAEALTKTLGPADRPRCADGACHPDVESDAPKVETRKAKPGPRATWPVCPTCAGAMPPDSRRCPWCGLWVDGSRPAAR